MSEFVWIKPPREAEFEVPLGARVISRDAKRVKVLDDEGNEAWISVNDMLRPMHSTSISGVEDMIVLGDLQEHAILRNLLMRYYKDLIYTYTGTMLIAVNPYKILPIYSKKDMIAYQGKKIGELAPHIFAVGDNSYENMRRDGGRQCVVISGESGAGKTESTKLILQYLATISGKNSWIEQQILDSNPILEAFGNARTVRNDNSSRFGKYITLQFTQDCAIAGAEIQQYLLEKSRLVFQNKGERNYHIFYAMLAGLNREEKLKFQLENASTYNYLTGGDVLTCEGRDEAAEFSDIRSALKVLNFSDSETLNIFQLLAAILHIGNVQFKSVQMANMEGSEITQSKLTDIIGQLLGISGQKLATGFTKKSLTAQGETVATILNRDQALETRDAFVKSIYGNLFIYLVQKINQVIRPKQSSKEYYIGVLDIFGFENFENNSFEQLCINLANENLQQFFVHHIFKLEQEQYSNEGIDWKQIKFVDNQSILDMMAVKPMNILALIDEEAKFPKGTDDTMLAKVVAAHEQKLEFFRPKYKGISAFGINHFAGAVFYNVKDFLEKNRDSFSADLKSLVQNSQNQFLRALFPIETGTPQAKKKDTLALKFRSSLDELMAELGQCQPFFVRCIKPNELKRAHVFDRPLCCRQLRYSGMMETATIRQAGYPIRYTFQEFVERFRVLGRNIPPAHRADCKAATAQICDRVFVGGGEFRLGYTKIFLKTAEDVILDNERQRVLSRYILVLQKNVRGWLQRRRYQKLRRAAIVIQAHWRGRGPRRRFLIVVKGYSRLLARLRSRVATYQFNALRRRITALQAYCKGHAVRQWVRQKIQEKRGKMEELMALRRKEEADYKKAGKKDWRELALANWRLRLAELNISVREEEVVQSQPAFDEQNLDEQKKLVDSVFGYLDGATPSEKAMHDLGIGKGQYRDDDYIGLDDVEGDSEDYSQFSFMKFASIYFNGNVVPHFSKRPLRAPVLAYTEQHCYPASHALWITILRFMGDISEAKYESNMGNVPVMNQISQTLGRSFTKSAAYKNAVANDVDGNRRRKLISMTLKRANKIGARIREAMLVDDDDAYSDWINSRTENIDKLHFIIGHGILRPELRDEIFAQICKQLIKNGAASSAARGWVLLSLCIGCFPPSDLLLNPLKSFLQAGPKGFSKFCLYRLRRTAENGPRSQPPSYVEQQAIKDRRNVDIPILLMDGSKKLIQVDSAMTAQELIELLARNIGMKDTLGFSLLVSMYDKTTSLGGGKGHVMDVVSQCEQYAREQGMSASKAPWKMYLRKEMFSPWHDSLGDPVATNLIYQQIVRGLKSGEYRCEKESDLALLAAQQYYIDHGLMDRKKLHNYINAYLPEHLCKSYTDDKILRSESLIEDAYHKHLQSRPKMEQVRADVVKFATNKWPLMFSHFTEVIELSGQTVLPKKAIVAALNSTGLVFVDYSEEILMSLAFVEIQSADLKESGSGVLLLNLITIEGVEMNLQGPTITELHELLHKLLKELKRRSKYVVVTQSYKPAEGSSYMALMKGDLLTLSDLHTGESLEHNSWGEGKNERSGDTGIFPTDCVAVVKTVAKPTPAVLALLKEGPAVVARAPGVGTIKRMRLYTLEKYAEEHFRAAVARRSTISRGTSLTAVKQDQMEEIWRHSREPLSRPLLRRLQDKEDLSQYARVAFMAILKYMGDQPTRKVRVGTEYTDMIFQEAISHEPLRDEIYCQIMKQLTGNRTRLSEERGWELMFLITGLFPCSSELEKELVKFLQSRKTSEVAQDCLLRFQRVLLSGTRRYPPHQVEVEAIQHKHKHIYHRIYFPDDSNDEFEVDSTTRASDLVNSVANRLQLKSSEGFSVFIKAWDKVFSVPNGDYFFDYIRLVIKWMKDNYPASVNLSQMQYQIYFMRKLWAGSVCGRDVNADVIFHFPQELPKYLRGYHKVSVQDATSIAALLYIAKFEGNKDFLQNPTVIQQLIPPDVYKLQKPKEWLKQVTAAWASVKGLTANDSKMEFLRVVQEWPTFGCAFFEVKQSSDSNYPEMILVALNRVGVHIMHPATKAVLAVHEYQKIQKWSSGNDFINITLDNISKGPGSRLLLYTQLAYKMDDLMASYSRLLLSTTARRKSVKSKAPRPPSS